MPKLLNVEANQRVDFGDFAFLATAPSDHAKHAIENFLTNPAGTRVWILSGFATDNPSANQVRVTKGAALLATKDGSQTKYGYLATEGDASKTIDIASYTNGTYNVYIRFEYQDGDNESRIFWNATGLGSEFAQVTPTRLTPSWSLRIEATNPGSEWFKVGEVVKSGSPPVITDMRNFYFEGAANTTYANTWGAGNDRSNDRALYGVRDLQTFTAAMRTKLEDLQGEGKRWWLAPSQSLSGKVGGDTIANFVVTGLDTSGTGGFGGSTTAGIAYAGGHRVQKTTATAKTYTASKDTYIDLSSTGAFTYTEVTNGAGAPAIAANSVRLAKVVTDGSSVTSAVDLRPVADLAWGPDTVDAAVGKSLHFLRANGTLTAPTIVADGNLLGRFIWRGFDGVQYRDAAAIVAKVDATPGAGDMPGSLSFFTTADGSTTLTERMKIDSAGRVVIGALTPISGTPVQIGVAEWGALVRNNSATDSQRAHFLAQKDRNGGVVVSGTVLGGLSMGGRYNTGATDFSRGYDGGAEITAQATETWTNTNRGARLGFWTSPNGAAGVYERLRIYQDGSVGIIRQADGIEHVAINPTNQWFNIQYQNGSGARSLSLQDYYSWPALVGYSTGGTIATPTPLAADTRLFSIAARSVGTSGGAQLDFAQIAFEVDGTVGASDSPGRISFHASPDGSSSMLEYGRMNNAGRWYFHNSGGMDTSYQQARVNIMDTANGRQLRTGLWADMSSNGGAGQGVFGSNVYTGNSDNLFYYSMTHGSLRASGMVLNGPSGNGIGFFVQGAGASTAGATFSPNYLLTLNTSELKLIGGTAGARFQIERNGNGVFGSGGPAIVLKRTTDTYPTGTSYLEWHNASGGILGGVGTLALYADINAMQMVSLGTSNDIYLLAGRNLKIMGNYSAGGGGIQFYLNGSQYGSVDLTNGFYFSSLGVLVGGATGGYKGGGTINAQAVYDDNVLLTCYVPEYVATGTIDLEKWDATIADNAFLHQAARRFLVSAKEETDPTEYSRKWLRTGHLPAMPSPAEWMDSGNKMSMGRIIQGLWETVEVEAEHIRRLNEQVRVLTEMVEALASRN